MPHSLLTPNKTDDYNYNHVKTAGDFFVILFCSKDKKAVFLTGCSGGGVKSTKTAKETWTTNDNT